MAATGDVGVIIEEDDRGYLLFVALVAMQDLQ